MRRMCLMGHSRRIDEARHVVHALLAKPENSDIAPNGSSRGLQVEALSHRRRARAEDNEWRNLKIVRRGLRHQETRHEQWKASLRWP
jgi:deferrochelatase/peroxidase EfeB